jgi:hypothetical protein
LNAATEFDPSCVAMLQEHIEQLSDLA